MTETRGRTASPPARPAVPNGQRVLVVDDEPAMLRALRINLRVRKYDVATASTGREALAEARRRPPDAVILDLGLPDVDGIEVIRELRGWSRAPVIVLSGRTGPGDKIAALDAGADDYVTKPFSVEELLARLRAALRRDDTEPLPVMVRVGRCEIDLAAHTALDGARTVRLTPTQWRLLEILLRHPGQLVGTQRLLTEIWGPGYERSTHYLRFHMAGLRRKLEADPSRPRHLLTEPGMGYRYRP
ncbi:MAG TPA: response regulator [Streptosporangiaceae bacterium]|nr:response regulator [Streptosporangiaceae bacterium]